jgi:hypothetical protein
MEKFSRILFGCLLLGASLLKLRQNGTAAAPPIGSSHGIAFHWWVPGIEAALACWLLSGRRQVLALGVATAGFAMFCGVTLFKISRGASDCGCFGN